MPDLNVPSGAKWTVTGFTILDAWAAVPTESIDTTSMKKM
jgi:hypothetical protein